MRRLFRLRLGRASIAREVDDELAFHLETRVQRLVAQGLTPDAAREEAMRQFGDVDAVRQDCVIMDEQRERRVSRANFMSALQQDFVYAWRTLGRNAGLTTVIVGSLALGIGANTAIFSLVNAVAVRGLPVMHPEQLVAIGDTRRVNSFAQGLPQTALISYPLYKDIRDQAHAFSGVLASGIAVRLDVRVGSAKTELEHPRGRFVSGNYFSVLGVPAFRGRVFDGSEDRAAGTAPVATISYGWWTRRFNNDPSVIGKVVVVDDVPITIIGVAPPAFAGEIVGTVTDIWLPASMHDVLERHNRILDDRSSNWLLLLGRLVPGTTLPQAEQELTPLILRTIAANASRADGAAFLARSPKVFVAAGNKGFSSIRGTFETPLFTLMVGVALLLCIVCANVANLLLARSIARGKEMAVRLALGANRARLIRQLLTESMLLSFLGGAMGLLVAWWGSRALLALASAGSAIPLDLSLDTRVMMFTLAVSFLSVMLFGLAPALRASRVELAFAMRANAQSVAGSALGHRGQRAPLGKLLIAGQVALSVVLLVGAAMLVRSLRNVQSTDVGFDRDHLLMLTVDANTRGYSGDRLANLAHVMHDHLAGIPGVTAVAFSQNGLFSGTESGLTIEVPGFVARTPDDTSVAYDNIGPGYIHGIGGRLVAGRDIETSDEGRPAGVAVVNQSFATFYFPRANATGKFIHIQDSLPVEIIGVMADTRDHDLKGTPDRRIYFSYVHPDTLIPTPGSLTFAIRTAGDPAALVEQARKTVVAIDPDLPIGSVNPLPTLMLRSIREERLVAKLASAFGVIALLLASIGLYGVMTYAITRRTGEIGLRVALGAQRQDIVSMVLCDALRLVAAGVVIGLPLALASTRLLRAQLTGIGTVDPLSIGVAMSVLVASAVIAVLLPALRASKVSPIVALRAE